MYPHHQDSHCIFAAHNTPNHIAAVCSRHGGRGERGDQVCWRGVGAGVQVCWGVWDGWAWEVLVCNGRGPGPGGSNGVGWGWGWGWVGGRFRYAGERGVKGLGMSGWRKEGQLGGADVRLWQGGLVLWLCTKLAGCSNCAACVSVSAAFWALGVMFG